MLIRFGIVFLLFAGAFADWKRYPIPSLTALEGSTIVWSFSNPIKIDRARPAVEVKSPFVVPTAPPSYLTFEAKTTQTIRVFVTLTPVSIPQNLAHMIPANDWANPEGRLDFRSTVSLETGGWKRHTLSLQSDFFEHVSRRKNPYELSGIEMHKLGITIIYPTLLKGEFSIRNLRIEALSSDALMKDLEVRTEELKKLSQLLDHNQRLGEFWKPRVSSILESVADISELSKNRWHEQSSLIDEMLLLKSKWSLALTSTQSFGIGLETSLQRLTGRHKDFLYNGSLKESVKLVMAQNEYESFQLVILPFYGDLRGIQISVSDLNSVTGSHLIPSDHIQVFHQLEQCIKPSPGTTSNWAGWIPDALLPVKGPFAITAVESKPLWITIHTPPHAEPGNYEGKIWIATLGEPNRSVDLSVEVLNFRIPNTGQFRTQGHFSVEGLQAWYGDTYSPQTRKDFYRLLVDHRMTPTSQYSPRLSPEKEDIPWIMEQGGNVILVGGFSGGALDEAVIDDAYKWLVDQDLIGRAVTYIGDETNDFEKMRQKARAIRTKWPRLRIMIGGSKPREELIGYMDIWDPITYGGDVYDFDLQSTQSALERGEEVFWYTCVGPKLPFANIYNDHPLTAIRALWWQAWKYGVTGFEYWWFNWWEPNIELSKGEKPWPLTRTDEWESRAYDWANGDGLLVFPGANGEPLPSLRLSVLRDAIEDWEVLFMLSRAKEFASGKAGTGGLVERATDILRVPAPVTTDLTNWSQNPEIYFNIRSDMYRILDSLIEDLGRAEFEEYVQDWISKHHEWLQKKFTDRVEQSTPH